MQPLFMEYPISSIIATPTHTVIRVHAVTPSQAGIQFIQRPK